MSDVALTVDPKTIEFRAIKASKPKPGERWQVIRYVGTDIFGSFRFETVSRHPSKITARREAARLNAVTK